MFLVGPASAQTPPTNEAPADIAPPPQAPRAVPATPSPPAYGASPPAYEVPPPAEEARGVRLHDGLYLRLSLGPGYGAFDGKVGSNDSAFKGSGFALSGTLMIGGTPAPGLVVGGATEGHNLLQPKYGAAGFTRGSPAVSIGLLYGFVDYFPDPRRGLHFGGGAGLASLSYREDTGHTSSQPIVLGGGAAAWVGYDFWVGKQWSLGVETRALGAHVANGGENGPAHSINALGGAVLFTALYH